LKVYEARTTAEGIRNWWRRDAEIDARVGGIGNSLSTTERFRLGCTLTNSIRLCASVGRRFPEAAPRLAGTGPGSPLR
jgi:hypothetical protein